jgi:hypothetical protein
VARDARDASVCRLRPVAAVAAAEQAVCERRPGGDGEVEAASNRQELPLDAALEQAVGNLQGTHGDQPRTSARVTALATTQAGASARSLSWPITGLVSAAKARFQAHRSKPFTPEAAVSGVRR